MTLSADVSAETARQTLADNRRLFDDLKLIATRVNTASWQANSLSLKDSPRNSTDCLKHIELALVSFGQTLTAEVADEPLSVRPGNHRFSQVIQKLLGVVEEGSKEIESGAVEEGLRKITAVVDALSRVRTDLEDVLRECGTEIFTAQHPTRRFFENQNGDFIIYDLENSCVWVGTARPAEYPLRETQSGRWTLHLPGQIISGIFEPSTDLSQFSPIGILDVEMRPHAGPEIMTITTPEATLSVDEFRLKAVLDPSGQGSVSGDLSGSILDTTEEGGDEVSWNGSVSSSNARLVPNQGVIFKEATISLKIELGNTCGRQIEASGPWLFASKARYCQFQPKNST